MSRVVKIILCVFGFLVVVGIALYADSIYRSSGADRRLVGASGYLPRGNVGFGGIADRYDHTERSHAGRLPRKAKS